MRFPSALLGSLAVVSLYFLVKALSENRQIALLASLFLALNPWHSFFSRAGYEVNFATSLLVIGTLFFVLAVKKKNALPLFILSVVCFVLAIYTYNVTRIFSPALFIFLTIYYYRDITIKSKKTLYFLSGLLFFGLIPFLLTFQSQSGFAANKDALLIGGDVKADTLLLRSYFSGLPEIFTKIVFNYYFLIAWDYLRNLVSFFSTDFFFIVGAGHPIQNIGGMGLFYYFEFPLIIYGVYEGIRKRVSFLYPFYIWLISIYLVGSIVKIVPHGTRTYAVVIPLTVLSAYGLYLLLHKVIRLKHRAKIIGLVLLGFIMLYSYLFYFTSYFVRFPVEHAKEWGGEDKAVVDYLSSIQNNYQHILIDEDANFSYTSLLFYSAFSPSYYQTHARYTKHGVLNTLESVGKITYKKIDWSKDLTGSTLIISGKDAKAQVSPVKTIYYPTHPVVLYANREILQFPVTDVAYTFYSSK